VPDAVSLEMETVGVPLMNLENSRLEAGGFKLMPSDRESTKIYGRKGAGPKLEVLNPYF